MGASVIVRLYAFLCVLAILASTGLPAAASEPRVALVIGNSEYGPAIGKLKNPANDARLMAETLKSLGFKVDLVLDADQKAMKRAIKGFGAKLKDAGGEATGLFYYAGHGVQVEGTNFLLPVGAEIATEADVEIESVSADDVVTQMQFAGVAVNLVFLDACRNNPLARTSRSATRGLARLDAPRGSFVGYSTAPGDVAADGDGANSPYALALVQELKTPGISIEEAHRNVRAKVLAQSGNKQTPWDSSSLTGAVVLVEKAPEPVPQPVAQPAPTPQPPPQVLQQASVDKEVVFWESIKGSKDPAEFEAYLKKYPDGTFADLAKAKVAALSKPAPTGTPAAPAEGSSPPPSATLLVTAEVKEEIDSYLGNLSSGFAWGLAITKDGSATFRAKCATVPGNINYSHGCSGQSTNGGGSWSERAANTALKKCGGPNECMILYVNERKAANVEIVVK